MSPLLRALALALSFIVASASAWAQQPKAIPIVGLMSFVAASDDPAYDAFRQGLRELGYLEGRNVRIEFRNALGHADRLPGLAEELVRLKPDVIVLGNPIAARAVMRASSTTPIVIVASDPLGSGLVTNLAHPGGNLTGLSTITTELGAKRLQLLKETIPGLNRLAVLWHQLSTIDKRVDELKAAAASLSIELKVVKAQAPEEFSAAFAEFRQARVQALYLIESPLFYGHRRTLAAMALHARLPTMYSTKVFPADGGLMSYGADFQVLARQAAGYVDKILKGAKPGDLPIEQATKLEFVINLKTAKGLNLMIPPSVLTRADEIIR